MFVDNDKDQAQDNNNDETDFIQWDTLHSSSYGSVDLLHGKGCHVYKIN